MLLQSGLVSEIEALQNFAVTDCGDLISNLTKADLKDVALPGGQAAAKNLSAVGKLNHRIYEVRLLLPHICVVSRSSRCSPGGCVGGKAAPRATRPHDYGAHHQT